MKLLGDFKRSRKPGKPCLGVAVDAGEIRAVRVLANGIGLRVETTARVNGPESDTGGAVDQKALTGALRELTAAVGYDGESVVSALPGMAVIERIIRVPVMPAGELESAIRFEAEQHIPVPLDDMILRYVVLGEEQNHERSLRTLVAAARRDAVENFQRAFAAAGLTLASLDLPTLALWRYFRAGGRRDLTRRLTIVNVDTVVTHCAFTEGERLLYSRTSPVGSRSIGLDRRPPENGNSGHPADFEAGEVPGPFQSTWGEAAPTAESLPGRVGEEAYEGAFFAGPSQFGVPPNHGVLIGQLAGEIKRSLDFFRSTYGDWTPEKVVLSGAAAIWPDLAGLFANELEMDVCLPGGIEAAGGDGTVPDPDLVTAGGLAMWGVKL